MNVNDDNLELDVTRMLDGELGDADRDELGRRLLRDPAAHRLHDATATVDAQAGEALREAFGGGRAGGSGSTMVDVTKLTRRTRLTGAAVAAAAVLIIAGAFVAYRGLGSGGAPAGRTPVASATGEPAGLTGAIPTAAEQLIWQVWDAQGDSTNVGGVDESVPLPSVPGPRDVRRRVDRQLFGVYDEKNQTVYLLGVDRTKTSVQALGEEL